MNGSRVFLDTNVVVYAYSSDETAKHQKAVNSLLIYDCLISTQVLNEFCNVCLKKLNIPVFEVNDTIERILAICDLCIVDQVIARNALWVHERYGFSYYDSLMVASAKKCECKYLFTEDLQNGQVIDGILEIRNPFINP
jgi:predicted nucleic acid-binding protein